MKQETSKKSKKWIWLVAGAVVLLAIVGVVLAMVLGEEPEAPAGGRADLYWNVDRTAFIDKASGLSGREPGEDGLYHVRFAINGEHVEYTTKDKKLINYIDTMDVMGLVFDDSGAWTDAVAAVDVATELGAPLYVQKVEGNTIVANISPSMTALSMDLVITENTQIYDVTNKADFVGKITDISAIAQMDRLYVYANDLEEVTHIFIIKHAVQSPVYWRAEQMYNSSKKETTREPDENGYYSIDFFCEGERVTLKCNKKDVVNGIDSRSVYSPHFGFDFDAEGNIIESVGSAEGIGGLLMCERYWITSFNGNVYTAEKPGTSDPVHTFAVPSTAKIYDVGKAAKVEGRQGQQVDYLNEGDRVCVWTNTEGVVVLVYVSNSIVDVPVFFNPDRQYDSKTLGTAREPDAQGYYNFELYETGATGMKTYKTNDKAVADYLDSISSRIVGVVLKDDNIIERAYDPESIFANTHYTYGRYVDNITGPMITSILIGKPTGGSTAALSPTCEVYNVSGYGEYGLTELKVGDCIYAMRDMSGEVCRIYILRRYVGEDSLYFLLDSQYDSKTKSTKREPDEDGWYRILTAHGGKQVTLRTRSKAMVEKVESIDSVGAAALIVSGDVIVEAYTPTVAAGGNKVSSGYRIKSFNDDGTITTYYQTRESNFRLAEDCVYYNVSTHTASHRGEAAYSLKHGDMLTVFTNWRGEAKVVFIRNRVAAKVGFKTEQLYDTTNKVTKREPDAEGWYYVDIACDGEVKTYKTKSKELMSNIDSYGAAFGFSCDGDVLTGFSSMSYAKGAAGNGVSNYDVVAVDGRKVTLKYNVPGSDSTGTTKEIYLSSNAKIYDISPTAEQFGAKGTLQVGDRIRTYLSDSGDKSHAYVFILYHDNRAAGQESYCDHCQQVVYWQPWAGESLAKASRHIYLNADVNAKAQTTIGSETGDYEIVLDLNGKTINYDKVRAFLIRYNDTLTIMDSVGNGVISGTGVTGGIGGLFLVSNATVNLYSGTITRSENDQIVSYGGIFRMSGATLNVYGGQIVGGTVAPLDASGVSYGGNIYGQSKSVVNVYGGKIGDSAANSGEFVVVNEETGAEEKKTIDGVGGSIYLTSKSELNVYGGELVGGTATMGGNVYLAGGNANLYGGVVADGVATNGGNFYVGGGCQITMQDEALITRGTSTRAVSRNNGGGNVFLQKNATLAMLGGSITDGTAVSYGGNVACRGGMFVIEDGIVSGGQSETGYGNNVYINGNTDSDAMFAAFGGQIVNGDVYSQEPNNESESRVGLSKAPVIEQLRLDAGALAEIYLMEEGADVSVYASGVFSVPYEHAEDYVNAGYIKAHADAAGVIKVEENVLKLINAKLCAHCGQEVEWSEWKHLNGGEASTMTEDGHYYLSDDILGITSQIRIGLSDGSATGHIVLDLNGHTMKSAKRVFAVYPNATLSIIDSVGGGEIQGAQIDANQNGGVIRVDAGATLNLYSGAITDVATEAHKGFGGAISTEGGTINIFGGTVNGGTTRMGGALYVSKASAASGGASGTLNISGGVINGGIATSESDAPYGGAIAVVNGNLIMTGGKVTGGTAISESKTPVGGNIYLSGNNTYKFEITGGIIENGTATNGNGGNIYLANGVLTIAGDAQIVGGTADRAVARTNGGGNIYGQVSTTVNINGGVIADGVSANSYGGNIFVRGMLNMTDGVISGGTAINGGNVFINGYDNERIFTMTGGIIKDGTATTGRIDRTNMVKPAYNGDNVYINSAILNISGGEIQDNDGGNAILAYTAKSEHPAIVNLTAKDNAILSASLDSKIYLINGAEIYADLGGTNADTDGDKIWVIEGYGAEAPSQPDETEPSVEPTEPSTEPTEPVVPEGTCPHCGLDMAQIEWTEWTAGGHLAESGHYYLSGDIAPGGQRAVGQNSKVDVVVDLRGYTYQPAAGRRTFTVYSDSTLTVLDTVGGAKVIGSYTADTGATINVTAGTVNLYGGTFSTTNTENSQNGGVIALAENCTLNVYEGATIIGGPAKFGGAIYASKGDVNIYGGLIQGGVASSESTNPVGGAIAVLNGDFVMTGGKVSGGTAVSEAKTATGGNIYLSGNETNKCEISGGIIENGVATNGNGGNIYLNAGILTISGDAQIIGGSAQRMTSRNNGGGNIYVQVNATLNIEGGLIANGVSVDSYGGNVFSRGNVNITAGEISGGTAINGGNLFVNGYTAVRTLTISGGTIKDGTATTGAIDRTEPVKPAYDGDNIYVNSAIVNITGGMITDNDGGNAILAFSPKSEYPAIVNLTVAENAELANALNGKVYAISGATVNADLGNTVADSDNDLIWYAEASIPEATEPSTEATEPSTEPSEPSTEPTEPVKPESEGVCPCHGLTVAQIDEITKANASDAKAWVDFDGTVLADGVHYRLNSDLTLAPSATSAVIMVAGEKSMLYLNGHNITVFVKGVSRRLVHLDENCQLTICGNGEISGNGNGGGVVYMKPGAVLNLYEATLTNSKVNGTARGGVIVTEKPASGETPTYINMYSGTMNAGAHSGDGGCVTVNAFGEFHMYGGTLNGTTNDVAKKGGAVYASAVSCVVDIQGGVINGGNNTGDGSAICMYSSPMLTIKDATINGSIYTGSATAGAVMLSGTPVIKDLRLVSGASIALGEGGVTGGSIGITAETGAIAITSEDAAKSAAFFVSNVAGLKIAVDANNQISLEAEAQSVSNLTKAIIVNGLKGKMLIR